MIARLNLLNILVIVKRVVKNLQLSLKFLTMNFFENLTSHSIQSTIKNMVTKTNVLIRTIVPTILGVMVLEKQITVHHKQNKLRTLRKVEILRNTKFPFTSAPSVNIQRKDTRSPKSIQNVVDSTNKYAEILLKCLQFKQ